MDNVELIIELSTEIARLRREVEAKHNFIQTLKEEMTAKYALRESNINSCRTDLCRVFAKIGDMREPGAGIAPTTVDAAIEDLEEIESRIHRPIRNLTPKTEAP